MAEKHILICDGCGVEMVVGNAALPQAIDRAIRVVVADVQVSESDLCPDCKEHLIRGCDPKNWPRAAGDASV